MPLRMQLGSLSRPGEITSISNVSVGNLGLCQYFTHASIRQDDVDQKRRAVGRVQIAGLHTLNEQIAVDPIQEGV